MLSFIEYLAELVSPEHKPQRVLTNPSTAKVEHALKHSTNGELRYLHNTKTGKTHVADAGHFIHQDIADWVGDHGFKRNWEGEPTAYNQDHYHAGFVDKHNIDRIKKHPGGLKGHIHDVHKDMPNVRDFE